jgi:hypothetical protein
MGVHRAVRAGVRITCGNPKLAAVEENPSGVYQYETALTGSSASQMVVVVVPWNRMRNKKACRMASRSERLRT